MEIFLCNLSLLTIKERDSKQNTKQKGVVLRLVGGVGRSCQAGKHSTDPLSVNVSSLELPSQVEHLYK